MLLKCCALLQLFGRQVFMLRWPPLTGARWRCERASFHFSKECFLHCPIFCPPKCFRAIQRHVACVTWQLSVQPVATQLQITRARHSCCISWCLPVCAVPRRLLLTLAAHYVVKLSWWAAASFDMCNCCIVSETKGVLHLYSAAGERVCLNSSFFCLFDWPQDRSIASTSVNILFFRYKSSFNHVLSIIYFLYSTSISFIHHEFLWPFVFIAPSPCDIVGCLHLCVWECFHSFYLLLLFAH